MHKNRFNFPDMKAILWYFFGISPYLITYVAAKNINKFVNGPATATIDDWRGSRAVCET